MRKKKILMLVRTSGLEYDDRIRKEILTLHRLGYSVQVLANYVDNRSEKGKTFDGVPFKVYSLITRKFLPSGKFLPIKMLEFWLRVLLENLFARFDFVWVHEEYMALNILIKPVRGKYIFDLHELPERLIANEKMMSLYRRIEVKCHKLIVANEDRLIYMNELGIIKDLSKYCILNNFPDRVFLDIPIENLPSPVLTKLDNKPYLLMQGGGHFSRYPIEILSAIKRNGKFMAIIVGPISKEVENTIENEFDDLVYLTGYVKQLELPKYIDNSWASIIFYAHTDFNNFYCEPNRLYQALNRGIPVIVGNNPPMSKIVENTGSGVVLNTDGSNVDVIIEGINQLEVEYTNRKDCASKNRLNFIWENQEKIFKDILS
jgi:glycosyltransferase involved in cell wall biosynthesis